MQRREITVTLKNKNVRKTAAAKTNVENTSLDLISDTSEASVESSSSNSVAAANMLTQVTDQQQASVFSVLNPNAIAFNHSACKNVELIPSNVPLSETIHVIASNVNENYSPRRHSMKHATAKHSQTEAYKEQAKVTEWPLPLNNILPSPLAASKNSMRGSLHHTALN